MEWLFLAAWLGVLAALTPIGLAVLHLAFADGRKPEPFLAKLIGLFAVSGLFWLLGYARIPVLTTLGVLIALGLLGGLALGWLRKGPGIPWREWGRTEAVFAGLVLFFLVLRGFYPTVFDTEKPMEMMMISSSMRAHTLPPEDAWYAGMPVNYYYFGFFVVGLIAKASGVSSFLAFNFGLATVWAASVLVVYGIGRALVRDAKRALLFPLVFTAVGNLGALWQLIGALPKSPEGKFDWWTPSRMVPEAITEFPAFTYLLGDLHSHVLGSLWLLVLVALLFQVRGVSAPSHTGDSQVGDPQVGDSQPEAPLNLRAWGLCGLVAGQLFVTNTWSALTMAGLGVCLAVGRRLRLLELASGLFWAAVIVLPYMKATTSLPMTLARAPFVNPSGLWAAHWAILACGAICAVTVAPKNRFVATLLGCAVLLIGFPEVAYFEVGFFGRVNTVFKLWWDAWILLTLVAAYGFVSLVQSGWGGRICTATAVAAGAIYLPLGLPRRLNDFQRWYGIDPQKFAFRVRRDLAAPYRELRQGNAKAILETPGQSFTGDSLLSAWTGVPTYLGWVNHEWTWRGDAKTIERRKGEAMRMLKEFRDRRGETEPRFDYVFLDGKLVRTQPLQSQRK